MFLAALATAVAIILWFASYAYPGVKLIENYDRYSLETKMSCALLPNIAISLGIRVISSFEAKGTY